MKNLVRLFLTALVCVQCTPSNKTIPEKSHGLITEKAMVVSARNEASKIGVEIMKQGGNAFDAMIATDLALLVSYPSAGNIGGGGFMVYRQNNVAIGALDYREKAPSAATKNMYLDAQGTVNSDKSQIGALAVGVPGTIAGLFEVYEKFGTLPFEKLIAPAIELAEKGVVVTEKQAQNLNKHTDNFKVANRRTILLDKVWKKGDTIKYPKLTQTLKRIQIHGRDEFYKGETASENIMIVDLVRNDLSKIAQKGSVAVTELCQVHSFKQVHHMISTVQAEALPNVSPVDIIAATFPMGSMTGAPKLSAMNIIESLEETKRGLYSGAVGYFTPNGNFDFNVVIRSILYNATNAYISFSVGSAITSKSTPEKEYEECLVKAKAMRSVLEN